MKRASIIRLSALCLLFSVPGLADPPAYRPGEIIVKYRSRAAAASIARISLQRAGAAKIQDIASAPGVVHAAILTGQSVESAISALLKDPDVEYAQPNYIYRATALPDDTNFGSLWGLKNTGQTITALSAADAASATNNPPAGATTSKHMDMEEAWDQITDCSSVVVAVVDTGIKYDHEDLTQNMWSSGDVAIPHPGHNSITGAADPTDPMDDNGHGTHVAGTIGARGDNGKGTAGICWQVQLMGVKALGADGSGSTADVANGITWAVSHGAQVINLSLGSTSSDPTLSAALDNALANGVVVVAAAGNAGSDNDTTPTYPCSYNKADLICVAALDQAYSLASFSNYGASSVHVGAPGVNIASTWPFTVTSLTDDLSSGWTLSPATGGWTLGTVNYPSLGGSQSAFAAPFNYDGSNTYGNSVDYHAYKTFDLSGNFFAKLAFYALYDTESSHDYINVFAKSTGGDPVSGGTQLLQLSGNSTGLAILQEEDVGSCLTTTCSIGIQFSSDATGVATGGYFFHFELKKSVYDATSYNVIQGTSMAAPHVAGLAAMLLAYNPSYTYSDVIAAILGGGTAVSALSGKTTTGKAVNAMGSLSFIRAPAGVTAVKQ